MKLHRADTSSCEPSVGDPQFILTFTFHSVATMATIAATGSPVERLAGRNRRRVSCRFAFVCFFPLIFQLAVAG